MRFRSVALLSVGLLFVAMGGVCDSEPVTVSGVQKVNVDVPTDVSGMTIEQKNIRARLMLDNKPGSIKHLYIISAFSGDVLIYSTVKGKVTSSGKRLTPNTVAAIDGQHIGAQHHGFGVVFGGNTKRTGEVLQDDGTYGSSIAYLFWWDAQDRYHQQYVTGGMILHICDQPIVVNKPIISMEDVSEPKPETE